MSLQTLNGKQIRNNVIEDRHIKDKLSENVLDIIWNDPAHAESILKNKSIIDYVQNVGLLTVPHGVSEVAIKLSLDTSTNAIPGVVLNQQLRFRDENGDPLRADGKEIIGKITATTGVDSDGKYDYTITFTDHAGAAFTFATETKIEFLYPIKTTLWDAAENFASNERFVDGAVDIRTRLDLIQIAKDVYGDGYSYNADGTQTQSETLKAMLERLSHGSTVNTQPISATDIIDEVYTARDGHASLDARLDAEKLSNEETLQAFKDALASTLAGKGAALIGHNNDQGFFLSDKLNEILDELGALIKDAEGSKSTVTERLNESLRPSGVLKDHEKIHTHGSYATRITVESSTINFVDHSELATLELIKGIDQVKLYVNGSLQAETFNYTLTKDAAEKITGISISPDTVIDGDIVIIEWTLYNKFKA